MAGRMIRTAGIVIGCAALSAAHTAEILQYTENVNSATQAALGYPVPMPVDSMTAIDGFRSYDSLHAQHQALMLANDEMTGQIVGTTFNGRDIWAYVIGDADNVTAQSGQTEPAAMINGTTHSREWGSPEVVTDLMEQLMAQKGDEHVIDYILDNVNLVILPVLNVDGFLQTQRFPDMVTPTPPGTPITSSPPEFDTPRDGRMRRKNMRGADESLDTDADRLGGVDLNRNNVQFFNNGSNSTDPTSLVYRGTAPASEPEIQALQQAAMLAPENRLRFYEDAHAFGRLYFIPNPSTPTRLFGNTSTLASRMSAVTGAFGDPVGPYFPAFNQPDTGISGTAPWFAHTFSIPAWTLEIEPPCRFPGFPCGGAFYGGNGVSHDGFILPDAEIAATRDELTASHILGLYHQAGPASVLKVVISDMAGNVVFEADWNAQSPTTRSLSVNTNQPLLEGNSYNIYLAFDKPMRHEDVAGNIAEYPGMLTIRRQPIASISIPQGSISLNFVNFDGGGVWHNTSGGFPGGFMRYKNDAITASFTVPTNMVPAGQTVSGTLDVLINDMAMMTTDANPATVADFANGGWTGYETSSGAEGDVGGTDRTITLRVQSTRPAPQPSGGGPVGLLWLSGLVLLASRRPRAVARLLS